MLLRLCCSAPHASSWIRALPTSLNKFSNLEWVIAMKRWLGIPIYNEEHLCVVCHKQIMDIHGHHAAVCSVSGGDRVKRHHALRDCFHEFCSNLCSLGPVTEKPFLLPFSSERPADIFVPNFSGGKGLVVDFACTCPIQQKYVRPASQTVSLLATNTPRKPSMTYVKAELSLKVTCTFQLCLNPLGACQMMQLILLKKCCKV